MSSLGEYMINQAERPYALGTFDCGVFAANCVAVATGKPSPLEALRYDPVTYRRMLVRAGGVEALITFLIGSDPLPMSEAENGNPVLMNTQRETHDGQHPQWEPVIGIYYNDWLVTPNRPRGLKALPTEYGLKTWATR